MAIPFKSTIDCKKINFGNTGVVFADETESEGNNTFTIKQHGVELLYTNSGVLRLGSTSKRLSVRAYDVDIATSGLDIYYSSAINNILTANNNTTTLGSANRTTNIIGEQILFNGNGGNAGQVLTSNGGSNTPSWKDAPGTGVQLRRTMSNGSTDDSPTFSSLIDTGVNYINKNFSLLAGLSEETNVGEIMALDNNGGGSGSKYKVFFAESDKTMRGSSYEMTLSSNGVFSGSRYSFEKFNITTSPEGDNMVRNKYLFGLLK